MNDESPSLATVDLCDKHRGSIQVALPVLKSYGKHPSFSGQIETVKCYEDNVVMRKTLEQPGNGRVLIVDGGGSLRCALVGDRMAALGVQNGWAGIVVNGCVRDITAVNQVPIGIRALGHVPLASEKHGQGVTSVPVSFAGITFTPGHHLYADADGIVVSEQPLSL